jgi:hypothetical protein
MKMRFPIMLAILVAFISNDLAAAYFRSDGFLADNGILETMRLQPDLPMPGESFTVRLTGSWPEVSPDGVCRPPLDLSQVIVYPGNFVKITSLPKQDDTYCDQPPATWSFDATIPASAWDAVDENGYLRIVHSLFSGINMLTDINQVFDMRLGTHEVPAFIGSGFWISSARPLEGILVEQQGSRVLFYGLRYDRNTNLGDEGEPVWQLVAGEMYGDSTLGRAYRYDWPFDLNNMPLEAPGEMEVLTVNDSGAIIVDDYNHIRVFTEVNVIIGTYDSYNRVTFGIDRGRLPNYAPPLDGRWNLYGFEGQNAMFTTSLELLQGRAQAADQYSFASADGEWLATCTVVAPGTGDCSLERGSDGVKLDFPMTAFQGNLARGSLKTAENDPLDGVLVREPWTLPVLNHQ